MSGVYPHIIGQHNFMQRRTPAGSDSCGSDSACPRPMGNAGAAHDTDPIQLKIDANAAKEVENKI